MKKIGLICLSLVVALGALGVGYAMWTDTVTIDGTVTTGNVDLVVTGYSGTWVWKLPNLTPDWERTPDSDFNTDPVLDADGFVVAWAEARQATDTDPTPGGTPIDDAIFVEFHNLFPTLDANGVPIPWEADFECHYEGSVPVKVNFTPIAIVGDPIPDTDPVEYYDLSDLNIEITGQIWRSRLGETEYIDIDDLDPPETLQGMQLEYCDRIKFIIAITIPQYTEDEYPDTYEQLNEANMGLSGTITGLIQVVQWNEYEEP